MTLLLIGRTGVPVGAAAAGRVGDWLVQPRAGHGTGPAPGLYDAPTPFFVRRTFAVRGRRVDTPLAPSTARIAPVEGNAGVVVLTTTAPWRRR
jgi:hypothetical protein